MKEYVLGFAFFYDSAEGEAARVVLIRKQKPESQKGLLNGLGGSIESNESPSAAMAREFREESGVEEPVLWHPFGVMRFGNNPDVVVHLFSAMLSPCSQPGRVQCDEGLVGIFPIDYLNRFARMTNLDWLIPMALDALNKSDLPFIELTENAHRD